MLKIISVIIISLSLFGCASTPIPNSSVELENSMSESQSVAEGSKQESSAVEPVVTTDEDDGIPKIESLITITEVRENEDVKDAPEEYKQLYKYKVVNSETHKNNYNNSVSGFEGVVVLYNASGNALDYTQTSIMGLIRPGETYSLNNMDYFVFGSNEDVSIKFFLTSVTFENGKSFQYELPEF